jgi:hypothetical protein
MSEVFFDKVPSVNRIVSFNFKFAILSLANEKISEIIFFKCLEIALPILSKDDLEFNKKCLTDLEQFAFQVLLFAREPTDISRIGPACSSESDSRNFPSTPNELKGFPKIRKCPSAEAFEGENKQ